MKVKKIVNTVISKSQSKTAKNGVLSRFKKPPFTKYLWFALGINTSIAVAIIALNRYLPPEVPLFYGLPEGKDQLTNKTNLILPSLISILILSINTVLALLIKDDYLRKALIIVTFAVTLLSIITTIKIILLVIPLSIL